MDAPQVLIVGAGPTGLVLALWLTRLGVPLRIIDCAPEPGTTSRALGVQARTLELYHQVGLDQEVMDGAVAVEALNLWVGGRKKARAPIHRMGEGLSPFPFVYMYAQDVHERMLIAHLARLGVKVERPAELLRFEQGDDGVTAFLRLHDGGEEACTVPYLAGCDGASSTVRKHLGIGFPGGTYAGRFYVADVEAEGPSVDREIHLELEEADFLAVFPLKERGHVRLIGAISWEPDEEAGLAFEDVSPRALRNLQLRVERVNWFSTYRVHHRVAERFREGRVFLLGDAAHIHSPAGAQGMNTGIGDAINLAWKLAGVLKGEAPAWLLDTYQAERIGFARQLVATTDRVFSLVTRQGALARFIRTRIAPAVAQSLLRSPLVRRFMFRTISQIGIRYPESPLSRREAGDVKAGDRLPWVPLGEGKDNFAPLASLGWQVHVYGTPSLDFERLRASLWLPGHTFPWRPEMGRAGLQRGACYLVRPDGYVAFADPECRPERLQEYWTGLGWDLQKSV